jgi:L-lactate dehydrogenase
MAQTAILERPTANFTKKTGKGRVVIIGAGSVGAAYAFQLMNSGLVSEICIIDLDRKRAEGEVMDLSHGASFVPPVRIWAGDYRDCHGADLIVITAGARQRPGQTRLELVEANYRIFQEMIPEIVHYTTDAILLIVTNPVDVMTYLAHKISGLPHNQVLGSGTVLDTSRFRFLLSQHCKIDPRNVHAYIVGEHGDSEVAVWSLANIAGMRLAEFCPSCERHCEFHVREELLEQVRRAAYEIIERKGSTSWAVALAMQEITEAILRDQRSVLTVSCFLENYFGTSDICLSVPAVVARSGVERVFPLELSAEEKEQLLNSSEVIRQTIDKLNS